MRLSIFGVFFVIFFAKAAEPTLGKEIYNGLIFRDTPQVVDGPNQNLNIFPHLDTLRKVDKIDENDGWIKVNLYYDKGAKKLSAPITSWIWHANYAQYVEPYFPDGVVASLDSLKQKEPANPKKMKTHSVSLSDSFHVDGIPTRNNDGKKKSYWAPADDDSSPLRLIYTIPDMQARWVPREVVEDYNHVSRAKVDFEDAQKKVVFKKGDHLVELSFDEHFARVYSLNDPDRVVFNVPVEQLRSLQNTEPLKLDVSEVDSVAVVKSLESNEGLVARVPAGKKQEFVNSKMKSVTFNGPLKLVKLEDGKGSFSWATRVQVIDAKGKSLGNFYISNQNFDRYHDKNTPKVPAKSEDSDEDEGLREKAPGAEIEVPESNQTKNKGHLGDFLGKSTTISKIPVKYEVSDKNCGERAGKYAKYYYEEPKLSKRSNTYKQNIVNVANDTDLPPDLLATMIHIESKYNPRLENNKEKDSVGGDEHHKSNPSIWGKGIAQLGRNECKILGIDWYGTYAQKCETLGSVWHPETAIAGMAELLLKKVKEVNEIEKKHNQLVAAGKRKRKIEPPGSLIKFMLDRESFQPPPPLKADGSNKKEIEQYHQVAYAEKLRYLTSMYNRGMRAPEAILAYLERTGSFPGYYGQAWSEPPHSTQTNDQVLFLQQINRGHVYRAAGLCGALPEESASIKYGTDYQYDSSSKTWSLK